MDSNSITSSFLNRINKLNRKIGENIDKNIGRQEEFFAFEYFNVKALMNEINVKNLSSEEIIQKYNNCVSKDLKKVIGKSNNWRRSIKEMFTFDSRENINKVKASAIKERLNYYLDILNTNADLISKIKETGLSDTLDMTNKSLISLFESFSKNDCIKVIQNKFKIYKSQFTNVEKYFHENEVIISPPDKKTYNQIIQILSEIECGFKTEFPFFKHSDNAINLMADVSKDVAYLNYLKDEKNKGKPEPQIQWTSGDEKTLIASAGADIQLRFLEMVIANDNSKYDVSALHNKYNDTFNYLKNSFQNEQGKFDSDKALIAFEELRPIEFQNIQGYYFTSVIMLLEFLSHNS